MKKITFWTYRLHRYFGIALAIPMLAWCLSGVVMMYVGYPSLPEGIRLDHLSSLAWGGCCAIGEPSLSDDTPITRIQVEMLAGHPVLRINPVSGPSRLIDLTDGHLVDGIGSGWASGVAAAYGPVAEIWSLTDDQWTVADDFTSDRPLFHVILSGTEGAELYVSSASGKAVQFTTRRQRFWNWLGRHSALGLFHVHQAERKPVGRDLYRHQAAPPPPTWPLVCPPRGDALAPCARPDLRSIHVYLGHERFPLDESLGSAGRSERRSRPRQGARTGSYGR